MLSDIDSLFLNDLLLTILVLCSVRSEAGVVRVVAVACVAALLEKGLVAIRSPVLLLDDEVGRATQVSLVGGSFNCVWVFVHQLVRILADVFKDLASLSVFYGPPSHVVVRFLLLETL